jgi:hypothetical protein
MDNSRYPEKIGIDGIAGNGNVSHKLERRTMKLSHFAINIGSKEPRDFVFSFLPVYSSFPVIQGVCIEQSGKEATTMHQ